MSSMMVGLSILLAASIGPMPDGSAIGTVQAPGMCANDNDPNAIVVCAQRAGPSPRLPMRDDRFAAGEVVHYLTDGPQQDAGPPGMPSRLAETIGKGIGLVKSLITGEDPGF